ncbi:MAG: hypothetical protein IJB76_01035 [Clostridia bacterium]|nr:hypothetical protein [Clostridia bacterium]
MNKTFLRIISLLLAALCLPVFSAFASTTSDKVESPKVTTETISELRVSIEFPAGGRVPAFEATAHPSSMMEYKISNKSYSYDSEYYHNYYKNGIQWYDLDNGRALKAGEAFVTGTRYRVDIVVEQTYRTDIMSIPYYKFASDLKGYVNGAEAEVKNSVLALDERWFRQLSYTFPPCEDAPADITSVSLWLDAPVTGSTPDFEYTTSDKGYKTGKTGTDAVNGVLWYDSTGTPMSESSKFVEDETYTVAIELNAISPYMFATKSDGMSKVSATVNGYSAQVYCNAQTVTDMDKAIWVKYTFEACKKIINSVEVIDFSLPLEGKKGDISMSSSNEDVYKVEAITWESSTETIAAWNGKTGYSSQNGVFEAGVTYMVTVTLAAQEGYAFAIDTNGKPNVAASAAGFELDVNEHYFHTPDTYIMVSGSFICRQIYVTNVNIVNIDAPLAGKRPDYSANSIGVGYRIETEREAKDVDYQNGQFVDRYYKYAGISWYDLTDGRYIYEDETYILGHTYIVYIDIVANSDSGYEFKINNDGDSESLVTAAVNDNIALAVSKPLNAFWNQYVEVTMYCNEVYEGGDTSDGNDEDSNGGEASDGGSEDDTSDDSENDTSNSIKGDANGDGYVNSLDAAQILKYDAMIISWDMIDHFAADVNRDGYVDSLDAARILKFDAGIIVEF